MRSQHRLQNIVKNVWCGKPSITILAEDGSIVARYGDITGAIINAAQLPPHVLQAVMAVEDRRFTAISGLIRLDRCERERDRMAETSGSVTPAKAGGIAPGPQSGTGCGGGNKGSFSLTHEA